MSNTTTIIVPVIDIVEAEHHVREAGEDGRLWVGRATSPQAAIRSARNDGLRGDLTVIR